MKPGIINKINKIRGRRPQKDRYERPIVQIPLQPPRPLEVEKTREAPARTVIIIDLM